ncbi:MAG TPA: NAD(P)H-quinone oxidoreductase [Gemmatimonadaceae bacterium]
MKAVVIARPGGPEVLEVRDVPRPRAGYRQVLVRVHAAGLNRADIMQREGRYPPPNDAPADIPGLEFAGEVAELGPGAVEWRVGQRVFGIVSGGAFAEYLVVHGRMLAEIPEALDFAAAAAVPEAFITAHDALVAQACLRGSERVLIHAVGSGVGLAAVQLVRALGGVPYGTSRTEAKITVARELGLEDGVAITNGALSLIAERVAAWTGGAGVDIVIDLLGGPYVAASLAALAVKGRHVLISTLAGAHADLPIGTMLRKRLTLRGTVLRSRPLEEKIAAVRAFGREVVPMLARGMLRPVVDRTFPLDDIRAAHAFLESNESVGKVVMVR